MLWSSLTITVASSVLVSGGLVQPGIVNQFQENNVSLLDATDIAEFGMKLSPLWRAECRKWSRDEIYQMSDKVEYNRKYYQAKWWTSGSEPGKQEWGAWSLLGTHCSDSIQEEEEVEAEETTDIPETSEEENNSLSSVAAGEVDPAENEIDDTSVPLKPGQVPTRKQAEAKEREITSSDLFTMVKHSISTLPSKVVDKIKPGSAGNPENVRRVEKLLSASDWEFIFPDRHPDYTYRRFLQAMGKFPAICGDYTDGRNADLICKKTLATMFAHFTQETGGHNPHSDVDEWRQGLVFLRESGCSEDGPGCGYDSACDPNTWQGKTWPCGKSGSSWKKYFGRGAKQLSYNYNYGPFSDAMFGSVFKLLENPDLVASTWLNLASATWFYAYPQPPKPSMLHVIDGTWQPNQEDKKNKIEPGFGSTIMIINGGIECGHGYEKPQATNRQNYYKNLAKYFKIDISNEELSCAHMKQFSKGGAGSLFIYWDREWIKEYECKLVSYQTPFNALKRGDYTKCVEDQFKVKLK